MKPNVSNGHAVSAIKRLSAARAARNIVGLNSIYLLTLIVTIATLAMFWIEFLFPKYHVGLTRSFVYYSLLTFYVVCKEAYRWVGWHGEKRVGAVWVLIWWTSTFLMEVISFLGQERFTPLEEQYLVTVAVSVNFLLSRLSRCLYERRLSRR
ncbi:MAG: hypothetical protein WC675_02415 [Patescibacteria group bacterium]|jgi:hypothetical protein